MAATALPETSPKTETGAITCPTCGARLAEYEVVGPVADNLAPAGSQLVSLRRHGACPVQMVAVSPAEPQKEAA